MDSRKFTKSEFTKLGVLATEYNRRLIGKFSFLAVSSPSRVVPHQHRVANSSTFVFHSLEQPPRPDELRRQQPQREQYHQPRRSRADNHNDSHSQQCESQNHPEEPLRLLYGPKQHLQSLSWPVSLGPFHTAAAIFPRRSQLTANWMLPSPRRCVHAACQSRRRLPRATPAPIMASASCGDLTRTAVAA